MKHIFWSLVIVIAGLGIGGFIIMGDRQTQTDEPIVNEEKNETTTLFAGDADNLVIDEEFQHDVRFEDGLSLRWKGGGDYFTAVLFSKGCFEENCLADFTQQTVEYGYPNVVEIFERGQYMENTEVLHLERFPNQEAPLPEGQYKLALYFTNNSSAMNKGGLFRSQDADAVVSINVLDSNNPEFQYLGIGDSVGLWTIELLGDDGTPVLFSGDVEVSGFLYRADGIDIPCLNLGEGDRYKIPSVYGKQKVTGLCFNESAASEEKKKLISEHLSKEVVVRLSEYSLGTHVVLVDFTEMHEKVEE